MHGNYFLMQNDCDLIFNVEAINLLIHQVSGYKNMFDENTSKISFQCAFDTLSFFACI